MARNLLLREDFLRYLSPNHWSLITIFCIARKVAAAAPAAAKVAKKTVSKKVSKKSVKKAGAKKTVARKGTKKTAAKKVAPKKKWEFNLWLNVFGLLIPLTKFKKLSTLSI